MKLRLSSTRVPWLLLVAALLLTILVYWSGLYGGFLFDDYPNLVSNEAVKVTTLQWADWVRAALSSTSSQFKRPLSMLSFAANVYINGRLDPFWMKFTNLVIHLLNGVVLFALTRRLLWQRDSGPGTGDQESGARPPLTAHGSRLTADNTSDAGIVAALIAGAWMLLPINLTGVLYVVQRMESLANLFVLLGLLGYVAGRQRMLQTGGSRGGLWLAVVSLLLATGIGVLAKETAVMTPLYAFLIEWALFRFRSSARHPHPDPLPPAGEGEKRATPLVAGERVERTAPLVAGEPIEGAASTAAGKEEERTSSPVAGEMGERAAPFAAGGAEIRTGPSVARGAEAHAASRFEPPLPPAGEGRGEGGPAPLDKRIIAFFIIVLAVPLVVGLAWLLPGLFQPDAWATRDFTLGTRLLSEARIVSGYVFWIVLPTTHALSFYHDNFVISTGLLTPWTTLAGMVFLAALVAACVWLRRRAPLAALGLALFLGCQLLTGTILPLELIYEHRNYFASFGLLLALIPWLAVRPPLGWSLTHRDRATDSEVPQAAAQAGVRRLPMALPRYVLLIGLLLLWTTETAFSAWAWGNPLRLAEDLAARAPGSPRAQYEEGRTYIMYSHYDPHSAFTQAAYAPLERAMRIPHSSILPEQALIFMNSRMHRKLKDAWWQSMDKKLRADPPDVQDVSSLLALTRCIRDGACDIPKPRMLGAFLAALTHPKPSARLLSVYSDYAWNGLADHALGLRMTQEAVEDKPDESAYRITLARRAMSMGKPALARQQIEALKKLNIAGSLDGSIRGLEKNLARRKKTP